MSPLRKQGSTAQKLDSCFRSPRLRPSQRAGMTNAVSATDTIYHQFHFVLLHSMPYNTKLPLKTQAIRPILPNNFTKTVNLKQNLDFRAFLCTVLGVLLPLLLPKLTNF